METRDLLPGGGSSGITRFELAIVLTLVALTLAVLLGLFQEMVRSAERANYRQEVGALKSAVSLNMLDYVVRNDTHGLASMIGGNPVDLLREPLSGYVGTIDSLSEGSLRSGQWGFDPAAGELVYAARFDERGGAVSRLRFIRWSIEPLYQDRNGDGRFSLGIDRLESVVLKVKK